MFKLWLAKSLLAGGFTGGAIQAVVQGAGNGDPHTELLLGLFSMIAALGVATITAFATIKVANRGRKEAELAKENRRLRRENHRNERIISSLKAKMEESPDAKVD